MLAFWRLMKFWLRDILPNPDEHWGYWIPVHVPDPDKEALQALAACSRSMHRIVTTRHG